MYRTWIIREMDNELQADVEEQQLERRMHKELKTLKKSNKGD